MLRINLSILVISAVLLIIGCQSVTYNGATKLKGKTFYDLTINGHAILEDVKVDNVAHFSSALEAKNSEFNQIDSVASVILHDSLVKSLSSLSLKASNAKVSDAMVKNNIEFDNSTANDVSFAGSEGVFKNSKIKSIKNVGFSKKRVVVLIDTHVTGSISFESTEDCKILLRGTSKVDGATINATVEK